MGDGKMVDTMIKDALWDAFNDYHMGVTAENIAKEWGLNIMKQIIMKLMILLVL